MWSRVDASAERVLRVEYQFDLGGDERSPLDRRDNFVAVKRDLPLKHAADDALLFPCLASREFAVSVKARKLGTCARPAWRAVVFETGTEHKVAAIGDLRRA